MKTITSASTCLAGVLLLGGCTLINSLDDVKSQVTDGGAGTGKGGSAGKGGGGGAAEDSGAVDASGSGGGGKGGAGGNGGAPPVEAGVDGLSGGDAGGGGGAGGAAPTDSGEQDSGFGPNPPGGIIVAYNKPQGTPPPAPTLVVMDPKTGEVLHSEPIGAVKGIANDGLDDYWYIFVQEGTAAQGVTLHVRKLRDSDGTWKEYASLPGLPLPVSRIAMLHDRLAYLSAPSPTTLDPLTSTLTILDTIDKTAPKVLGGSANATRLLPSGRKQSLIGKPAAGTGGTVDVLYISSTCAPIGDGGADACPVQLAEYTVGALTVQAGATKVAGHVLTSGVARIDRDAKHDAVVLALPASPAVSSIGCTTFASAAYSGSVQKFATLDFSGVGQPLVNYPMDSESITGAVYDACLDTMYVASQNFDRAVYAVPLSDPGAVPAKQCRGNGIASLVFEPSTRVLILGQPGGGVPEFLGLGGSALAPSFASVTLPKIPATFSPVVIGVRQPSGYTQICP